ncbi:hypothetical protein AMTR_s00014p00159580 [Amborella trichopoda]|uniref:Uncharacterized protein n=1 Tax=Amborella trichopoda TaxID=13333 RepID=W1PM39_AMBTC|nr:hypothetical protein AMTR_s00014p00159580 [Amborella trichopoda]
MRMAWETCLDLSGLRNFMVPHYGRVGHVTNEYRRWWDSTNYKDQIDMKNLLLQDETRSLFDDLDLIFVGGREGTVLCNEGGTTFDCSKGKRGLVAADLTESIVARGFPQL